jgi:hypothetical protein
MRVVCQQPNYFPWLGYFEQIARADSFVYLDNVQWIRQGRQHRTRIPDFPGSRKEKNWLTVPVLSQGHRARSFADMEIDRSRAWTKQHWLTLQALYGRAPYFSSQFEPLLRPFFEKASEHRFLIDLCEASVALFWAPLRLKAAVWHASDLPVEGKKSERLVNLCQALESTEYYSALGASRYLDNSTFRAANIQVRWQHFRPSAGPDPRRPCDYSILDWVALADWKEIRTKLGEQRGTFSADFVSEGTIDRIVSEVPGAMH